MVRKSNPETKDEIKPPSSRELRVLLGSSYAAFEALTRGFPGVRCQWRRYGKKSPWVLKVIRGERTLIYITPKSGQFDVTVVLGERSVEAALSGRVSESLHESIRSAKPYVEGRSIRVVVSSEADVGSVKELLAVKLSPEEKSP